MSYTDVTLNGVSLLAGPGVLPTEAVVSNVVRGFLGAIRDNVEDIPGRYGTVSFDEKAGDRVVTLGLTLLTDSPALRRAAIETLADWAELLTPAPLIISDEPDRYWLAKLRSMSDPEEAVLTAEVELGFRTGPYALALEPTVSDALALTDGVEDTLELEDAVPADPIVEVTVGAGGFPGGFVLTVNGVDFVFGDALTVGQVITISTVGFTVSSGANTDTELDGSFVEADLAMSSVDGDFPALIPGTNTITIVGGDASLVFTWRRRYRA